MANCTSSPLAYNVQLFYSNECFSCSDGCGSSVQSSACVQYKGPNLSCSGIETDDSVEVALQKIDEQICSAIGDYSNYQFNCLPDWWGASISTEAEFVNAITDFTCEINDTVDTFINTTFSTYQSTVNSRFLVIETPGTVCSIAGLSGSESLQEVLDSYCDIITDISDEIDVTSYSVDWDQCMAATAPTTLEEAFSLVIDQICSVEASSGSLPTFNNTTSCLPSPGSSDSLVSTIDKIKTYICALPELDNGNLSSTCITVPGTTNDLEGILQNILDALDELKQNYVTFDTGDFDVTATGEDPCSGITVALQTPIDQDRFVAVSASDASPGTLFTKLSSPVGTIEITNVSDTTVGLDIAEADYGDITIGGSSAAADQWTINSDVVTFAKMQNISTSTLIGRSTAGTGDPEEITIGDGLDLSGGVLSSTLTGKTLLGITVFTGDGTWTKPAECNAVIVHVIGAGGGGGGAAGVTSESAAGGGGGGGAHIMTYITGGLSASETVTVGTGGAGGAAGNNDGSNGGNSSFGSFITAQGGSGGKGMASGTAAAGVEGGAGGLVLGALGTQIYYSVGDNGTPGIRIANTVAISGAGGASAFGSGTSPRVTHGSVPSGNTFGVGGNGGICSNSSTSIAGGNGGPGRVIVYEYT